MPQVKKLSVAKVAGKVNIEKLLASPGKRIFLMRCGGRAVGTKEGLSDYGKWISLVGNFVAISGETGEESRAPYLFLPDVALVPIQVALSEPNCEGVDFLIDVFAVYAPESSVHYEYTWEPVVSHVASDPITALFAQAVPLTIAGKTVGGTLALTAPAVEVPAAKVEIPAANEVETPPLKAVAGAKRR